MRISNVVVSLLYFLPTLSAFQSSRLFKATTVTKSTRLDTSLAGVSTFKSNFKSFLVGPNYKRAVMETSQTSNNIPDAVVPSANEAVVNTSPPPMEALGDNNPLSPGISSLKMPSLSLPDTVSFDVSRLRESIKLPESASDIALPDVSEVTKYLADKGFQFRPLDLDLSGISERDVTPEIAELPVFPMDKLISSLMQMETIFVEGDPLQVTVADYLNALNLKELGPWYLGAFAFLALTSAVGRSNAAAQDTYQPPVFSFSGTSTTDGSKAVEQLERQVMQLTDATNLVMKELRQLKEEKADRESQLAAMQKELANMKTRLEEAEAKGRQLQADLDAALQTSYLQAREIVVLKLQKKRLEKDLAEAKALQQELEKSLKAKTAAQKAPQYKIAPPKTPPPVTAYATRAGAKEVEIVTSGKSLAQNNLGAFFFAAPALGATEAKHKLKEETTRTTNGEDWSNLSLSTLKRKTVKELVDYLEAKGASTTGDDGKMMKKSELVEAVMTMK